MLEYKIHVINRDLNFDKTYKNVVQFFNTANNTKDYTGVFTNDELTFTDADETINFDLFDSINASVVLDTTSESAYLQFNDASININKALNRQYCIIQEQEKDDDGHILKTKLYFYFIDKAIIKNEYLVKYDLILDVFTTYPLFSDVSVDKTKIARAHVNRFVSGSTLASATLNLTSNYLQTGEEIESKINTKEQKASINIDLDNYGTFINKVSGSSTMTDATIKDIIKNLMWVYVFRHTNDNRDLVHVFFKAPNWLYTKYNIDQFRIFAGGNDDVNEDTEIIDFELFYKNNDVNDAYIYNAFITPLSPFGDNALNYCGITYNLTDSQTNLDIIFKTTSALNGKTAPARVAFGENTFNNLYPLEYTTEAGFFGFTFTAGHNGVYRNLISYFEKTSISLFNNVINSLYNTPFSFTMLERTEPKTKVKQAFNEYILKSVLDSSELKLDLTQLQKSNLTLKLSQSFGFGSNGEILITCDSLLNNRLEIRTKAQFTPQLFSDKFKEWKATNKNYELTSLSLPITATAGGATSGAVIGGKLGGTYGALAGAIVGGVAGMYKGFEKVVSNVDNMKNAPDSIKLKGQNFMLDLFNNKPFFYIEHNELKDAEKQQVNFYFYEYGYNINEFNDIKNFFTRRDFNYIELADCEKDVHALLNDDILKVIISALNRGVRFWSKTKYTSSKFTYNTNNLESNLT